MIDPTKLAFVKRLSRLGGGRFYSYEVFRDFCTLAACSLSMGTREEEYMSVVKRYEGEEPKEFARAFGDLVMEMEEHPMEDLLGPAYMELTPEKNRNGEFYTPQSISRMMAEMAIGEISEIPEGRPLLLNEPACGSGNMVLAAWEVWKRIGAPPTRLHVTAQDISKTACDMCYVNMSLHGIPGRVIHGNTLTGEEYGSWETMFYATGGERIELNDRPLVESDEAAALVRAVVAPDAVVEVEQEPVNEIKVAEEEIPTWKGTLF